MFPPLRSRIFRGDASDTTDASYDINTKPALHAVAAARKIRPDNREADENSKTDTGKCKTLGELAHDTK